jgi:hypothetical protein
MTDMSKRHALMRGRAFLLRQCGGMGTVLNLPICGVNDKRHDRLCCRVAVLRWNNGASMGNENLQKRQMGAGKA